MLLPGVKDAQFDDLDHQDEGNGVGEYAGNIEELEEEVQLKADTVAAPQQFDHQHDLPNESQAGARGGGEVGAELGQDDVTPGCQNCHGHPPRDFVMTRVEPYGPWRHTPLRLHGDAIRQSLTPPLSRFLWVVDQGPGDDCGTWKTKCAAAQVLDHHECQEGHER